MNIYKLGWAIDMITSVHTKSDDTVGFSIIEGASVHHPYHHTVQQKDYVEAWRVLLKAINRNEPDDWR